MKALYANKHNISNAVLFQFCWFTAILGEWYLALIPLVVMFVHLVFIKATGLFILIVLSLIGMTFDSIYHYLGVYQFAPDTVFIPLLNIPLWLSMLWLAFCMTLPVSLAWMLRKPYLFVLGCSLLGPVSYMAGRRFGVLEFSDSNAWFLILEWSVFSLIALIFLFSKLTVSKASLTFFKKESIC
jgi:hypothetical protein